MLSDNDKKKLKDIKKGLKSIEANLDNLGFVYKVASNLFRISDNLEDNNLKSNIKCELTKITQTQYKEEIQQKVLSIFTLISEAEKMQNIKRYFQNPSIKKTEEYEEDCKSHSNLKKNIEELEKKIIKSETYQENLHEKMKQGVRWKDHLHARLTGNLRLMYIWDPETKLLTFKGIITKNELEKD